jgi:hypothetical protein
MRKYIDDNASVNKTAKPDKIQRLAAQLLADRQRSERSEVSAFNSCFLCARGFVYRHSTGDDSGRFCSARCREAYDHGARPSTSHARNYFTLRPGPHGFYIICGGCDREFESKGLRFCSSECERHARERAETASLRAEVNMEAPVKRKCAVAGCEGRIPNWTTNGRKTSSARKYCDRHNRSRPKGTD